MRHARSDYDRIQDPDGKIPDDEPVFLLRGRDAAAPAAVRAWARRASRHGASTELVTAARAWATEMERYQDEAGAKTPDAPAETLTKALTMAETNALQQSPPPEEHARRREAAEAETEDEA